MSMSIKNISFERLIQSSSLVKVNKIEHSKIE